MKRYISICKNVVLSNLKHGKNDPPIRMSSGKHGKPTHHHELLFSGTGKIVYNPSNPMPWGARAWIEIEDR